MQKLDQQNYVLINYAPEEKTDNRYYSEGVEKAVVAFVPDPNICLRVKYPEIIKFFTANVFFPTHLCLPYLRVQDIELQVDDT